MSNELKRLAALFDAAEGYGFAWPSIAQLLAQVQSECQEVSEAMAQGESAERVREETADLLHAVCVLCFYQGYSVPDLMAQSAAKFADRFAALQAAARDAGYANLQGQPYALQMQFWSLAKKAVASESESV